jgi:hypothetical protein
MGNSNFLLPQKINSRATIQSKKQASAESQKDIFIPKFIAALFRQQTGRYIQYVHWWMDRQTYIYICWNIFPPLKIKDENFFILKTG